MNYPYFQVVATNTSYYTVNLNGDVTTFSQSASASATGTNADDVVKQASLLAHIENVRIAHKTLASTIVKQPNQLSNWSNISSIENTDLVTTVITGPV